MNIILIAYYDLKIRLQDKWAIFLNFIAPMLIIILAALSFGNYFLNQQNLPKIIVLNFDASLSSGELHVAAKQQEIDIEILLYEKQFNYQQPKNYAGPTIILPENFKNILLESKRSNSLLDVELISNDYSQQLGKIVSRYIEQLALNIEYQFDSPQDYVLKNRYDFENTQQMNAMSIVYFAPSMLIFFVMYSAFTGSRILLKEKESGLLSRILCMPLTEHQVLLGKLLAIFTIAMLQISILILSSILILNVSWGQSNFALLLLATVLATAFVSLGTLIVVYSKDYNQANIIGMGCILLFSCIGGNFVPVAHFPDWVQFLSYISLNRWGLDGILDITLRNQTIVEVIPEITVLAFSTLLFFYLSLKRFKRMLIE